MSNAANNAVPKKKRTREQRRRRALAAVIKHFLEAAFLPCCCLSFVAIAIRLCDSNENLVKVFSFTQEKSAPPIGEGDLLDALYYRKKTYFFCAFLLLAFLTGLYVAVAHIRHRFRWGRSRDDGYLFDDSIATYYCCDACSTCVEMGACSNCEGSDCGSLCSESGTAINPCIPSDGGGSGDACAVCCIICGGIVAGIMLFVRVWQKCLLVVELKNLTKEFVVHNRLQVAGQALPPSDAAVAFEELLGRYLPAPSLPAAVRPCNVPGTGCSHQASSLDGRAPQQAMVSADLQRPSDAARAFQERPGVRPCTDRDRE